MKRKLIAVDLDDVLSQSNETMRLHVNETYGTNHTPEDYLADHPYFEFWERVQGVSLKEGEVRYQSYKKIRNSHAMKPIPGAIEALRKLEEDFELVIVSARSDSDAAGTKHWLQTHYPSVFKDIHFVPGAWEPDNDITKGTICKEIGADYLIDDSYEHCEQVAKVGVTCLLFGEYGWSRHKTLPPHIRRVKDWAAVLEYFDEIR